MVFSSLIFIFAFLPITVIIYHLSSTSLKNAILLCASLFFYAWGEPKYVLLIVISIFLNYKIGLVIEDRKIFLIIGIILNLGCLAYFKYTGFIVNTIASIAGINMNISVPPLPIGISFYTFQALSYIIDVYRGKIGAQKRLSLFALYISMFPQLVAGPIVNYGDIETQLSRRSMTYNDFIFGLRRFICGLSKKVLLANNIGILWTTIKNTPNTDMTILLAWLGICSFALQIYFDFSGYSDMAIGLGKMFGFSFKENFNYPYISLSITEFWQRWHISLGSWFREYVYIPLGGNRQGIVKQVRNLIVVWFLTGLWHGASWNFVLWGMYYGALIIVEKIFLLKKMECWPKSIKHIYTLLFVVIGWVFFEFTSLKDIWIFLKYMLGNSTFININTIAIIKDYAVLFLICFLAATPIVKKLVAIIRNKYKFSECVYYFLLMLLSTAYSVASTFNPFIYFRF